MPDPTPPYVPLHIHSEYSALDGAIRLAEYRDWAVTHETPAVSVTDHGTLAAHPEMDQIFASSPVKPIFGCELYSFPLRNGKAENALVSYKDLHHLTAYACDAEGHRNLRRLVSAACRIDDPTCTGPFGVSRDMLEEHHKGLIFSTACIKGEYQRALSKKNGPDVDEAKRFLGLLASVVGRENVYVEAMELGNPGSDALNTLLISTAQEAGYPVILTTDSHYLAKDKWWYDHLIASQHKKTVGDVRAGDYSTKVYDLGLPDPSVLWAKWQHVCPEAYLQTARVAERVERYSLGGREYSLPKRPGANLADLAERGLETTLDSLGITAARRGVYRDQLRYEMNVVRTMGFEDYFILVWDLMRHAREEGIVTGPGRGSAAGSVLAWSLGITQVDPIKYGLIFERFLNPDRISMPDIDLDFEDSRREEIIGYIRSTYGSTSVAPIANVNRGKWRQALRDAARVCGYSAEAGNILTEEVASHLSLGPSMRAVQWD